MEKTKLIIYFTIILFGFFGAVSFISAAVSLPWSTTYNCADWIQGAVLNCDGLSVYGGWTTANGSKEQITAGANNPDGVGGKGQRHWLGDGVTNNSGGIGLSFNNANEFWIRWHMRYEIGFQWQANWPQGQKWLYINPGSNHYVHVDQSSVEQIAIGTPASGYWSLAGNSWNQIMVSGAIDVNGNKKSDGQWHSYEAHLKMDTNGSDGIIEMWIDGILRLRNTNVNYGTQSGWDFVAIGSNSSGPNNGKDMYVDYDDIAVSTTGYIGPIFGGAIDITPPAAPMGLIVL